MQITFSGYQAPVQRPRFGNSGQAVDKKMVGLVRIMEGTIGKADAEKLGELARKLMQENYNFSEIGLGRNGDGRDVYLLFTQDTSKSPFTSYDNYYRVLYAGPNQQPAQLAVTSVQASTHNAVKIINTREGATVALTFNEAQRNGKPEVDVEYIR